MVVALKVVTPAGVIETKEFPRTAQGWDIFRLFVGAEGTLGVITEATLHIYQSCASKHQPRHPLSSGRLNRRWRRCAG
ncbi:MAG: hypothetical protein MZV63_63825 [Marinilabiliales bacterium]|nr:hypothetical protein [Marinilabiliales bacterium]